MSCGAQWNCVCGECPLPGQNSSYREDAQSVIRELRQKLAIAGVEGSPPLGEETTIGALLSRAQSAEVALTILRTALEHAAKTIGSHDLNSAAWIGPLYRDIHVALAATAERK